MARLRIQLDLGPRASLGVLSLTVDDLSVVQDLGLRVDAAVSRRDAERWIESLWRENPDQLREQDLKSSTGRHSDRVGRLLSERALIDELRERFVELPPELWIHEWIRSRRQALGSDNFPLNRGSRPFSDQTWQQPIPRLSDLAPDLYSDLVAVEAALRMPTVPTVERLVYENPLEIKLAGVFSVRAGLREGAFLAFLALIRDWRADAGIAKARASQEETKAKLYKKLVEQGFPLDDLKYAEPTPKELGSMDRLAGFETEFDLDEDDDQAAA